MCDLFFVGRHGGLAMVSSLRCGLWWVQASALIGLGGILLWVFYVHTSVSTMMAIYVW